MEELQFNNEVETLDSREVAEMLGVRHSDLVRKINRYVDVLTNADLRPLDFFILTSYRDSKGENRPCFHMTKKGCEMVANKLTGDKGILFSAKYINRFHELEQRNQELKEDNDQLYHIAESPEELAIRQYQADRIKYSTRNIHDIIFGSTYRTLEDNVHKIVEVNRGLKRKDRYKPDQKLNDTEYLQKVRDKISDVLEELSDTTHDAAVRVVSDKENREIKDAVIATGNRSSSHKIYYREKTIKETQTKVSKVTEFAEGVIEKWGEVKSYYEPDLREFTRLDAHGFTINKRQDPALDKDGRPILVKNAAYQKWQNDFPYWQCVFPQGIDFNKPVDVFLRFDIEPKFDVSNMHKEIFDALSRAFRVDDRLWNIRECSVNRYVNQYSAGKIYYLFKQGA